MTTDIQLWEADLIRLEDAVNVSLRVRFGSGAVSAVGVRVGNMGFSDTMGSYTATARGAVDDVYEGCAALGQLG